MRYSSLGDFLGRGRDALGRGPIAMIFAEDPIELDTTIRHHRFAGFRTIIVLSPDEIPLPADLEAGVHRIDHATLRPGAVPSAVNAISAAAPPGTWLYYCYNSEFLFHPFSETRTVGEMLAFHAEERRDAMLAYVVDLYARDLDRAENAVSLEDAHLDRTGYYALGRKGPDGQTLERQLDFFGGLRWRFEEHVPESRRRIDRVALFRATPGVTLLDDHTFSEPEWNTYACPWHHNLTAAICSFRTAKALRSNPGSRYDIAGFHWHNSIPFTWDSRQLLDLGLMEPGQWF